MYKYLNYLIQLADHLDKKGLNKEADVIDNFLKLAQEEYEFDSETEAVIALRDPDPIVRWNATSWLGEYSNINSITKMLDDPDPRVRATATYWVGLEGDINLITKMLDDPEPEVRLHATNRIGFRGDINLIARMLDDPDSNVRDVATHWIKRKAPHLLKEGEE